MRSIYSVRRWLPLILAVLIMTMAGCTSKGNVTGKVTFKGKPMPGGSVVFFGPSGSGGGSAPINPVDGTYSIENLPTGELKVAVEPYGKPERAPQPGMGSKEPKNTGPPKDINMPPEMAKQYEKKSTGAKHVLVPEQYTKPDTSGFKVTVKAGTTTFDIAVP